MRLLLTFIFALIVFISCDRKPYVSHKAKLEETGTDCSTLSNSFRITSNIAGERYELEKCLPDGFDKKLITSFRQGDTVVVKINDGAGNKAYKVTLDIDSYPAYRFLTIDNDTYEIGQSRP